MSPQEAEANARLEAINNNITLSQAEEKRLRGVLVDVNGQVDAAWKAKKAHEDEADRLKQVVANHQSQVEQLQDELESAKKTIADATMVGAALNQRSGQLNADRAQHAQEVKTNMDSINDRNSALNDRETAQNTREQAFNAKVTKLSAILSEIQEK